MSRKTILMVEDDAAIRDSVGELLREHGYSVDTADSGDEGYLALRAQRYDLMLLDFGMPGLDGRGLLRKLFEEGVPRPTVIIASAYGMHEVVARLDGVRVPFIGKPFKGEALLAIVKKYIGAP